MFVKLCQEEKMKLSAQIEEMAGNIPRSDVPQLSR